MKFRKSGIYKIINLINNQVYIGSSCNLKHREYTHFNSLTKNKHFNKHLQRAANKYGIENFKFKIIKNCKEDNLLKIEQFYLNKLKPHYNIRIEANSNRGLKLSEEHKKKIGIKSSQRVQTLEEKIKRANSRRGKKLSTESKYRMSIAKKGKPSPHKKEELLYFLSLGKEKAILSHNKQVELLNIKGEVENKFNSIKEASKKTGICSTSISKCCKGISKTAGKKKWRFSNV